MELSLESKDLTINNVIDENLSLLFLPFFIIQWLFCLPKFKIYKKNIRAYDITINIYSFLFVTFYIILHVYLSFQISKLEWSIKQLVITLDCTYNSVAFVLTWICNIIYKDLNISLVLKIQNLARLKTISKKNTIYAWSQVLGILIFYGLYLIGHYFSLTLSSIDFLSIISQIYFDINIMNSIQIITITIYHLKAWNINLIHCNKQKFKTSNTSTWNIFQCYRYILEIYEVNKKVSQPMVSI